MDFIEYHAHTELSEIDENVIWTQVKPKILFELRWCLWIILLWGFALLTMKTAWSAVLWQYTRVTDRQTTDNACDNSWTLQCGWKNRLLLRHTNDKTRGASTFSKFGVQFLGLGNYYPSTEKIDRSTQFGAVGCIITLYSSKNYVKSRRVRQNFGEVLTSLPNLHWLRPWTIPISLRVLQTATSAARWTVCTWRWSRSIW